MWPPWVAGRRLAWHRAEVEQSWPAGQWFAAVFHLDRLLAANPGNGRDRALRGFAQGALGRREQAAADYARALELQPEDATFLTADERQLVRAALDSEPREREKRHLTTALKDPRVLLLAASQFGFIAGSYAIGIWLPQIMKDAPRGTKVDALTKGERFERLEDHITQAELKAMSDEYKKIAGFALKA